MSVLLNCNFLSSDWGNIADWAMVVVTGVTGILLWKTLKSQIALTKIELSRYRFNTMPRFDVTIDEKSSVTQITENKFDLSFALTLAMVSGEIAKNFMPCFPDDSNWRNSIEHPLKPKVFHKNDKYSFGLRTKGNLSTIDGEMTEAAKYNFDLKFMDDVNTLYVQRVTYFKWGHFEMVEISHPEIVE